MAADGVAVRLFTLQLLSQLEPCSLVHGVVHLVGVRTRSELFWLMKHNSAFCGEIVTRLQAPRLVEVLRKVGCFWIARLIRFSEGVRVMKISSQGPG